MSERNFAEQRLEKWSGEVDHDIQEVLDIIDAYNILVKVEKAWVYEDEPALDMDKIARKIAPFVDLDHERFLKNPQDYLGETKINSTIENTYENIAKIYNIRKFDNSMVLTRVEDEQLIGMEPSIDLIDDVYGHFRREFHYFALMEQRRDTMLEDANTRYWTDDANAFERERSEAIAEACRSASLFHKDRINADLYKLDVEYGYDFSKFDDKFNRGLFLTDYASFKECQGGFTSKDFKQMNFQQKVRGKDLETKAEERKRFFAPKSEDISFSFDESSFEYEDGFEFEL